MGTGRPSRRRGRVFSARSARPAVVRISLVLVLAALLGGPARAQTMRLGDLRLATAVRLALVRDAATRGLDVEVTAQDGAVRLAGAATADAERVARGVAGVRSVNGRGATPDATPGATPDATRIATPRPDTPARPEASPWSAVPRAETRPAARPETPAEPAATHTVARGETLFAVARRYATTVDALRRLNRLGPAEAIAVGQRLRVR